MHFQPQALPINILNSQTRNLTIKDKQKHVCFLVKKKEKKKREEKNMTIINKHENSMERSFKISHKVYNKYL